MKVFSTYKILKAKAFNQNIDESWIDWAIEMIEAGYESENLYILAGQMKPYNQFELHELTSKVLQELGLNYSDKNVVIWNYVYYLISSSIEEPGSYYKTLRELKNLCLDMYMDSRFTQFYLLYYAKDDLIAGDVQWYWDGATRENIDQIIRDEFRKWIENRPLSMK